MRAYGRLVDLRAPAGSGGQGEIAVFHVGLHGDDVVVPWHHVGIRLHDTQVRHHCAEVGAHHGGERPVKVVGSDVDLVGVGHVRDLHRLPHPVPWRIDDGHVHGVVLEVRPVVASPEEALAGGHGHGNLASDV